MKRSRLSRGVRLVKKDRMTAVSPDDFLITLKRSSLPAASDTWLANQWPACPEERLDRRNYMNYDNLEKVGFDKVGNVRRMLKDHPDMRVVVLAELNKAGKMKGVRIFVGDEVSYYSHYELFAGAAHMDGFVELFHNRRKK